MEAASTGETSRPDEPTAATVPEAEVRCGSPFAAGTATGPRQQQRLNVDAGGSAEIAWGGVWAAGLILPFAAMSAWTFPLGGVMIAGLGEVLSLAGLTSRRPRWAIAALVLHSGLLAASLMQLL